MSNSGSDVKWSESTLIIRTDCPFHDFSLIMEKAHGLWGRISSPGKSDSTFVRIVPPPSNLDSTTKVLYISMRGRSIAHVNWHVVCASEWLVREIHVYGTKSKFIYVTEISWSDISRYVILYKPSPMQSSAPPVQFLSGNQSIFKLRVFAFEGCVVCQVMDEGA